MNSNESSETARPFLDILNASALYNGFQVHYNHL